MIHRTLTLKDGRGLAWREYGSGGGTPLVAVHGSPDSSALWALIDEVAAGRDIRVIAPDRPGFGGSTPKSGRSILDWVDDLDELTGHLGIHRYGLLAISGGSPYALAEAWAHPDRVAHLALLSVICPLDAPGVTSGASRQVRIMFWAARRAPFLLRPMGSLMARLTLRDLDAAAERLIGMPPPPTGRSSAGPR